MSASPSDASPKGERTSASTRRRARVIDAFIDLVLEGNLPPTTEQVAERAGISTATFFRYFETLDVMRRDAMARVMERFPPLDVAEPGAGPLDERAERFAAARVDLWEQVHLLARLQRSIGLRDPGAAQMIDRGRRALVDEARAHFGPELAALTAAQRDDALALIATLTSVESWEQFRLTYERSPMQTRRAWARAISVLLRAQAR